MDVIVDCVFLSENIHPIHTIIGGIFKRILPSGCELIKDKACGGSQRIPLFYVEEKSRETEFCNVDLLVISKDRIKSLLRLKRQRLSQLRYVENS